MRKILLVLVSVLLIASIANAAEYTQAIGAEATAQPKGRSITSDNSVLLTVWYTGSASLPLVGVSHNTALLLYTEPGTTATSIDTSAAAYDTVGEVVGYINNQTGWNAVVGPDGYNAQSAALLLGADVTAPGPKVESGVGVKLDCSTATYILAGARGKPGVINRLKSIDGMLTSTGADIDFTVYDGDTAVWRKSINNAAWISSTASTSSANTVKTFTDDGSKGLSASEGNTLVVKMDATSTFTTTARDKVTNNLSIVYDELKD